ncbi:MAG TPA: hypothetical protein VFC00_31600 [Micromonosporaceae bacterium]|nr:hypothetical protein [Micromonosporaceae bacterium]
MRRRRTGPTLPELPDMLARFVVADWWRPDEDRAPAPHEPYATAEDRYVFHAVQAHHRWAAARERWALRHGGLDAMNRLYADPAHLTGRIDPRRVHS